MNIEESSKAKQVQEWLEDARMEEVKHKKQKIKTEQLRKSQYAMLFIVGILLVFSVVQTIQINAIKDSGGLIGFSVGQGYPASGGSPVQASGASNTGMVGGC
jgi:hypothetical protein